MFCCCIIYFALLLKLWLLLPLSKAMTGNSLYPKRYRNKRFASSALLWQGLPAREEIMWKVNCELKTGPDCTVSTSTITGRCMRVYLKRKWTKGNEFSCVCVCKYNAIESIISSVIISASEQLGSCDRWAVK